MSQLSIHDVTKIEVQKPEHIEATDSFWREIHITDANGYVTKVVLFSDNEKEVTIKS